MVTKRVISKVAAVLFAAGVTTAHAGPTTLIYVNDYSGGKIYSYDAGNSYAESLVASIPAVFSMSSGPAANTLYMQRGTGLYTYDLVANTQTTVGGFLTGNALGEGRDGSLYAGNGSTLSRVNPNTGFSTTIGSGAYGYAG